MHRALLSLICSFSLLFGCAETRTPEAAAGGEGGGGGEEVTSGGGEEVTSEEDPARAPGVCPASYGDQGPTCADGDFPADCTYPEGTCGCGVPAYCGGAAPPYRPATWICQATPVPCPEAGSPCSGIGRCSDQPCGWQGVACEGGVWTPYFQSPPP